MAHRFPMKEISLQAGLSLATVDRALHGRAHVRRATRDRVAAAIRELERQYASVSLPGHRVALDVVVEAPKRFSTAVRQAFESEAGAFRPATLMTRFHLAEETDAADLVRLLGAIRKRGSQGVILKAPAYPEVADAARALVEAGIPVATFVTDLPADARLAYIGMDNHRAGGAAAWLMTAALAGRPADILLTLSRATFMGEEVREVGFRARMSKLAPQLRVHRITEGKGLAHGTEALTLAALETHPDIRAVYSIGGGNDAVLKAFETAQRPIDVFAAHDLDRSNHRLLKQERLSFVIEHDLHQDARNAYRFFLSQHRMLPGDFTPTPSRFSIVTPDSLASFENAC